MTSFDIATLTENKINDIQQTLNLKTRNIKEKRVGDEVKKNSFYELSIIDFLVKLLLFVILLQTLMDNQDLQYI